MRFHGFQGQRLGGLWRRCGGLWHDHPGPKEEVSKLGGSNIRVLEARGLAGLAGLAGRRMEQRSLARSMLWRDRRTWISWVRSLAACGDAVATESWPLKKKCCNPRGLEDRIFEARGLAGLARLLGLHARCSGEIGGFWMYAVMK
mgnify:CR=1 FL=1